MHVRTVASLGAAQTLAWASCYYLPAVLAGPMAADVGVGRPTVFAAFSFALVVAALIGPYAGRTIDRWGGRSVLLATNAIFAAGLVALASVHSPIGLFAAWAVLGVGMGAGMYEAAFAALVRLHGRDARGMITGITLLGGLASTVSWPLSTLLEAEVGWRGACLAWAALHLVVGIPLNALLPRAVAQAGMDDLSREQRPAVRGQARERRISIVLASVFAATWFTSTAMAAHLPGVLQAGGLSMAAAAGVGALVGPAQVAGRLLEFGLLQRLHPLLSARLASLLHPLGAAAWLLLGGPAAAVLAVLHGAGNGILTITRGTLPLVLFGPEGYGQRQGVLMVPGRIAQALAPWVFGMALDRAGVGALLISGGLGVGAFVLLLLVGHGSAEPDPASAEAAGSK